MRTSSKIYHVMLWASFIFAGIFGAALADDELQFVVQHEKAISDVYLNLSDKTRRPCRTGLKAGSARDTYICSIPEISGMTSIETYQLNVEGDDFDIRPIGVRVYASMRKPTVINLNLTDPVFIKGFWSSPEYYQKWINSNVTWSMDDFGAYLITRNLYPKLSPSIVMNNTRALVLKGWLDRAITTARAVPYQAVDEDLLYLIRSINNSNLNDSERKVFEKFGPNLSPLQGQNLSRLDHLQLADWYVYVISAKARQDEFQARQNDFCSLHRAFKQKWTLADKKEKDITSIIWSVNDSRMDYPSPDQPFAGCGNRGVG